MMVARMAVWQAGVCVCGKAGNGTEEKGTPRRGTAIEARKQQRGTFCCTTPKEPSCTGHLTSNGLFASHAMAALHSMGFPAVDCAHSTRQAAAERRPSGRRQCRWMVHGVNKAELALLQLGSRWLEHRAALG